MTPCHAKTPFSRRHKGSVCFFARRRYAVFLRRARPGVLTPSMRGGCRTEIRPDFCCESEARQGGEETGTCEAPEQIFAGMPWHAYRQCGGEALREYLFSRKAMANMKTDLHVRAPAAGQRNSAGASRHYSGMSAVENSALYGGMERSDRSTLLWA